MNNSNQRPPSRNNNGPRQQNRSQGPNQGRRPPESGNRNDRPQRSHHRPDHHNRSRPQQPSRGGNYPRNNRTMNSSQILMKYDQLLELHLKDRRKYFEYYNRVDDYQRHKLEKQFFASIEQLRKFEESLESWQKDYLRRKTDKYRLDLTYSTNHELPPIPEKVNEDGEFDDPHFTKAQRQAFEMYREDTEESVGSMEDYLQYKNSK